MRADWRLMRSAFRPRITIARRRTVFVLWLAGATPTAYATGDPLGWHHSPSRQITPDNVASLEPAWTQLRRHVFSDSMLQEWLRHQAPGRAR